MRTNIILLFIPLLASANLWDNIFSETLASSPMIISQSFNFKFPLIYKGIDFDAKFDYNSQLKTLNIILSKFLLFYELQVFDFQLELNQFIFTIKVLVGECSRYRLILNTNNTNENISNIHFKSKAFLLNLLFKYQRRDLKDSSISQYVFKPDLFLPHEEQHEVYQVNPVFFVDGNGKIVKIYKDSTKYKSIPFILASSIKQIRKCEGQIQDLTRQELFDLVKSSIESKGETVLPIIQDISGLDGLNLLIP